MPDHEDSLGGETFSGEEQQDPAEQSLGDGATMGGDTAAHSLGDQSTFGDANTEDELFDDGMELVDLSTRYTEEGVLGKGGMGEVILATDTRLNRKVAIKRILGKAARNKTAVQRFLTEAQSIAALNHTNIVQIYDYGRSTDGPFLIMECVQGGSLLEKCKAVPIELDEAVNIFGQLCDGLANAHAVGIIHRDIKPANVLMTEDGIPKLTDFGLAKDDTADTGMTMEGAVIGTLDFMPPEQRQAAELTDHRSDLWSLAATFYQMLTGKSPTVINIAGLPPKFQSVVAKALEESKEDRFQSALEMKEAVQQAATAGLSAARDLGEGECPSCGTTNPSDRKFCRNADCAASLEVDCLSCKNAMPMWEAVCGSCGTQQDSLIEEAKVTLEGKHDEAERFLNELNFDDALKAASVIGEQNDFRLQQFAAWHEEFSVRLEASRTSEHARLEELLREAHAHEQTYDYEAGLQTLTQVAPSLKQTTVSGNEDTAETIAKRLTTKQSRLKELEGIVRERVTTRETTGLLQIVEELLTFKPDRPEVQKLKAQLEKRDADLLEVRDNAVKQATQEFTEQQYAEAIATLNTVPEEVCDAQILELKTKANDSLNQLNNLCDRITTAVNNDQFKDLLPVVEECLTLKADQSDFVKLRQELIARETQVDARNQQIISQAQQHMQQLQFDEVVQTLGTIVPENQTVTTTGLIQQAHQLSMHRQGVLSAVPVALSNKNYQVAIKSISQYLVEIANADIQDPQIQQMLEEAKGKESASNRRNKKLVKLGIAAAVIGVLGFLTSLMFSGDAVPVVNNSAELTARTLSGHTGDVYSVTFSPDGKTLASAGGDGIKLWDVETGAELKAFTGHADGVGSVVYSPDGKSIASAEGKNIKLWDVETGVELKALTGYFYITSVAFSPDGKTLVSAAGDVTITLWDVGTGVKLKTLKGHDGVVQSVVFSPDGKTIASAGGGVRHDTTIKLWDVGTGVELKTLEGHVHQVLSVAFSPDGRAIASGSGDKTIKLWDSQTGAELKTLTGHSSSVLCVTFSPDGKTLASAGGDGIKLWDVETGEEIDTLTGHDGGVQSVVFSPDGKTLASAGGDETIKLWSADIGAEAVPRPAPLPEPKPHPETEIITVARTLEGHTGDVYSVAFSPDGKTIASGGRDTIRLWDAQTGAQIESLEGHTSSVWGVAFSPDGKTIVSGSGDHTIKLWNTETGVELNTLTGHSRRVLSVAFRPDGTTIASGSRDGTIKLWDVETGAKLETLEGHSSFVTSVAFSPDGKTIVSGSWDNTIMLWNIETGAQLETLRGHSGYVRQVTFSPDGKTLASAGGDGIKLWDVETGAEIKTLTGHSGIVHCVAFSPDGTIIASGGFNDKTIELWDVETGAEIKTLAGLSKDVNSVAFSPDGKTIVSASGGPDPIKFWDSQTGAERMTLGGPAIGTSVVFSPDGKTIASGSGNKTVKLWDVGTGAQLKTLTGHYADVTSVAFSPVGKSIASGSHDHTIKLWNIETGVELKTLRGHSLSVTSVVFSPDGKTIASAGRGLRHDTIIKLWDVETGAEIKTLTGHSGIVHCVAFSPDGNTIASGSYDENISEDHTVKLWDVETGAELWTLEEHVLSVAFSPDGKTIVSASGGRDVIKFWDSQTGAELKMFAGLSELVYSVAFSPDGKTIACGSYDRNIDGRPEHTVKLRDAETGVELKTLEGHTGYVHSVAFSPNGKTIASGSSDQTIKIWNIVTGAEASPRPTPQSEPDPVPADLPVFELPNITNTIGMTLNEIPAGTFMMGSPEGETGRGSDEQQHGVTISKAFYMQTTEVTQGQWMAVMGTEPWKGEDHVKEGPDYAATYVSWDEAVAYCKKLSEAEGKTYRLPTEAEWEYACRAGTKTAWSFGNDEKEIGDYAWCRENAYSIDERYAHQVRLKKPNVWGLYDMYGNVWEYCHDHYEKNYYQRSPENDPTGPASGSSRVLRGGSWHYNSRAPRSARRLVSPVGRYYVLGFRLVRELD